MLKQRVLTALALLLVLLPALFYARPEPFFFIAGVFMTAAGWEWARVNGVKHRLAVASGAVCAVFCAWAWWAGVLEMALPRVWWVAGSIWVLAGVWILRSGVHAWAKVPLPLRLGLGLAALGLWAVRQQAASYAELAHFNPPMLLLTFVLALLASLLAGLLPAWRAMQVTPAIQLKSQ